MDHTHINGFGARFVLTPGADIGAGPAADGSLVSAIGLSKGFITVQDGEATLLAGPDGTTGGVESAGRTGPSTCWEVESGWVRCAWPEGFHLCAVATGAWSFEFKPVGADAQDAVVDFGP